MTRRIQVAAPPPRPLMVFDGDCHFCRRWIARWQQATGDRVDYRPAQDPQLAEWFPEIPREQYAAAVQLIETDGQVYGGAAAVFRSLAHAPGRPWMFRLYRRVPGVAPVTEWGYRLVAGHRGVFSALTRLLWGTDIEQPGYVLTRWLFLRLLGVVYLVAFVSLWTQLGGLIGSHGILPVRDLLESVRQAAAGHPGWRHYLAAPTLCWFDTSDGFLNWQCGAGVALSVLLIAGVAQVPVLALLWVLYLSLTVAGVEFLSFQWDALLLETGWLAILIAPRQLMPRLWRAPPPSRAGLWLLRVLLFKLMFSSGAVKLSSGDSTWRNLTALTYHYETQPLPTWIGWYAHQLPGWFQRFSCIILFAIELGVPFLIFAPRRLRLFAAGALVLLQTLIAATGNYCFFNLLTAVLCLLLLDDTVFRRVARAMGRLGGWVPPAMVPGPARSWRAWLIAPVAAVFLTVSAIHVAGALRLRVHWPEPITALEAAVAPFSSINGYGLFAVMTTTRPEIIFEGSNDGLTWLAYEFKYKPGNVDRRPGFVEPHQPRLDWQMWFAALGRYESSPWILSFGARLLQGSPPVVNLLGTNPFPGAPPRYVRAVVYDYRFTGFNTRRATGAWWQRTRRGLYCPILTLPENRPDVSR